MIRTGKHACDVDKMNRILKENFVELHEAPVGTEFE